MNRRSDNPADDPVEERRQAARHPIIDFVWYKIIDENMEATDIESEGVSKMCDISRTGIGIYVTRKLPLHKLIFIELAANRIRLSAVGQIVNVREINEGSYRMGIRFLIIPPNDRLAMAKFWKDDGKS